MIVARIACVQNHVKKDRPGVNISVENVVVLRLRNDTVIADIILARVVTEVNQRTLSASTVRNQ